MHHSKPTESQPNAKPPPRRSRRARAAGRHPLSTDDQMRAAGIDPHAEPPADIDEFRRQLARRISVFIANEADYWRGCAEPGCRRAHSCTAPNIHCSNAPPLPPDPDGRLRARALAEFQRAMRARLAQIEPEA